VALFFNPLTIIKLKIKCMSQKNASKADQMENEGKVKNSNNQSSTSGTAQKTGQHNNGRDQKGKQDLGKGSNNSGNRQNSRDN
jgi:hypothetical protein